MANNLYNYIVNNLRGARLMGQVPRMMAFGSIYAGGYDNWKHDPQPLIFCMYSGPKYTHGLNIHYMAYADKVWLARVILMIIKGKQGMDGYTFYKMLKMQRMSIVKKCYRVYFTKMCHYRLVGHGINTYLYSLVYNYRDQWVRALNESTKPSSIAFPGVKVAYDPEELRNRVIDSMNSTNITKSRVSTGPSAPYTSPAPWIK
jgi:hypothetical protein